jgi:hypothetical protein
MDKCKEGKVVANHVFPISSVRILHSTLYMSIIKCYVDVAMGRGTHITA